MEKELKLRIISSILIIPFVFFIVFKGSVFFSLLILLCLLISVYEWHLMSKNKRYYIFGLFFLLISFLCTYFLRFSHSNNENIFYFFLILIICISTDIGGYVFGKFFGGPKLSKISPNKTITGVFGSYLTSYFFLIFYIKIFSIFFFKINFNLNLILFIFLISTVSQLGDLTVSYFKRLSKINDTGKIIPGHGGILDRIDGMIFSFPFSYFIIQINLFDFF